MMMPDYKDLIEQIYDGLYFVDTNRRITYWNKAAEKITGFAGIGNRIRILVEKTQVKAAGAGLNVTVSIGAALANPDDSIQSLIKRADNLLYKSKAQGRNCLTLQNP